MTDSQYYYLKELKKNNKLNKKLSLSIIKCIKNKLITFYISTTIFFLFFWYSASAFCAVYANTQRIFVTDSYMSSLMGLTYPFALYFISAGLRFGIKDKDDQSTKERKKKMIENFNDNYLLLLFRVILSFIL